MTVKLKIWFRIHVAMATLTLVLGWVSGPLSLAAWEPDVCEMECCIAEGHCCCATRHAYVKGREPKPGDVSLTIETTLANRCLAGYAASGISSQNYLSRAMHASAPLVILASISLPRCENRFSINRRFAAQPSSPRAPPACDGLIA
jgi:hypothetical protein